MEYYDRIIDRYAGRMKERNKGKPSRCTVAVLIAGFLASCVFFIGYLYYFSYHDMDWTLGLWIGGLAGIFVCLLFIDCAGKKKQDGDDPAARYRELYDILLEHGVQGRVQVKNFEDKIKELREGCGRTRLKIVDIIGQAFTLSTFAVLIGFLISCFDPEKLTPEFFAQILKLSVAFAVCYAAIMVMLQNLNLDSPMTPKEYAIERIGVELNGLLASSIIEECDRN